MNEQEKKTQQEEERPLSLLKDAIIDELLEAWANSDLLNKVADSKSLKELETILERRASSTTTLTKAAALAAAEVAKDSSSSTLEDKRRKESFLILEKIFPWSRDEEEDFIIAHEYFCRKHLFPWCCEYKLPCYYCTCKTCLQGEKNLPKFWKNATDEDAQCSYCRLDDYMVATK